MLLQYVRWNLPVIPVGIGRNGSFVRNENQSIRMVQVAAPFPFLATCQFVKPARQVPNILQGSSITQRVLSFVINCFALLSRFLSVKVTFFIIEYKILVNIKCKLKFNAQEKWMKICLVTQLPYKLRLLVDYLQLTTIVTKREQENTSIAFNYKEFFLNL